MIVRSSFVSCLLERGGVLFIGDRWRVVKETEESHDTG